MRGGEARERAFCHWTYRAIALGALVWLACCVAYAVTGVFGGYWQRVIFFACMLTGFGLAAAVVCWCGHRTIAAGAFTWWTLREPLPDGWWTLREPWPDGRWALKVITYESAFLWVLCAFWGLLIISVVFFDDWISHVLGRQIWHSRVPGEVSVLALGTVTLAATWLWRYRIAFQAIRWSNF